MNQATVCKTSAIIVLTLTEAPARELMNFLDYRQNSELLNERARNLPAFDLSQMPANFRQLKELLGARKRAAGKTLAIDCEQNKNTVGIIIHNFNAQFWVHYFRCGVGLVHLSFYPSLSLAETSTEILNRRVTHATEYQWFTHRLELKFFDCKPTPERALQLTDYFLEKINPCLVNPYTIYNQNPKLAENYKFVRGSLEKLKQTMIWAYFVCQQEKLRSRQDRKTFVYPHVTIACGNLKHAPKFEPTIESLLSAVGALAVAENVPYTRLRENFSRRIGSDGYEWERKHRHRIFLNLEQETREAATREKIAARALLIEWLKARGRQGDSIIKIWRLETE